MSLRDYQQQAVDEIRAHYAAGRKRVLLHLATGGGKTHIFSWILKTMSQKGKRSAMVVRGRKLVEQAHQRLVHEGVYHGVHMSNHWLYRPREAVQICSIDTLVSRQIYPEADLIVIDEAHLATSTGYRGFMKRYRDAYVLAVTATPYTDAPLRELVDVVVKPISLRGLIDRGYLVAPRYFCPSVPDLTGVRVSSSTKDYVQDQLSERMNKTALVGDIVTQWVKFGEGRPTVAFAVTVEHSKHIAESFRNAGIPAEHMEASTPDDERHRILERLKTGETKVVSNVGILCTGVDLPFLSCLILARPTKAYPLYVQQIGRGTRIAPGKENFLVLDHADNVRRHGFVDDEPEACLDGKFTRGTSRVKICKRCYLAYEGSSCPSCGPQEKELAPSGRAIMSIDGELAELPRVASADFRMERAREYAREKEAEASARGYKAGWVFHQVKQAYGEEIARRIIQTRRIPPWLLRG